jgi:hypothetical protein
MISGGAPLPAAPTPILERTVGVNDDALLGGGGRLAIFPGKIVLRIGKVTAWASGTSEIVHTSASVDLFKPRIAPPWFNTALLLHGAGGAAVASMPFSGRRELRSALQQAGFLVREHTTWFSMGGREAAWYWDSAAAAEHLGHEAAVGGDSSPQAHVSRERPRLLGSYRLSFALLSAAGAIAGISFLVDGGGTAADAWAFRWSLMSAGVAWGLAFAVVWRHRRARAVDKARVDGSASAASLLNAAAIAALAVEIIAFMAYASGGQWR